MGYTAVKGGLEAILAAEALINTAALRLNPAEIEQGAQLLVDQVMGEGGLYAPTLAALAIAQAEGDPIEAAFLLRAYRSTLPRIGYTLPADGRRMRVLRRISSTFKDIPGGQVLGRTRDYTQRLLDLDGAIAARALADAPTNINDDSATWPSFPSVIDTLREEGLVAPTADEPGEPADITRDALRFPAPRSARLQALARGETGFLVAVGYSAQRGMGAAHPTIAELRSGELPIQIQHPLTHDAVTLGSIRLSEVEMINHTTGGVGGATIVNSEAGAGAQFDLGYGVAFGRNERKAIAMSIIDTSMSIPGNSGPAADEEFVLMHCDSLESSGFVEHLKLRHLPVGTRPRALPSVGAVERTGS
jgi:alpha-D-ribose 1-methylphosphonate 5-triphosphate synthase subunit PhnI